MRVIEMVMVAALAACGVESAGPYVELPGVEGVYQCQSERDGALFVVELCWDGSGPELEQAIVENEERVTAARCTKRPVASCQMVCPNTGAPSCNAINGCYCN